MSTILPITQDPVATITTATTSRSCPSGSVEERVHVAPARRARAAARARSAAHVRIQRESRPCAVSVRTSRRSSIRARTVSTTRSSTSAEFDAHLALQPGDERDLVEIVVVHPLDGDLERVLERHAELLVGEHALELALRRLAAHRRRRPRARRRGCGPARSDAMRAPRGCPAAARRTGAASAVSLPSTNDRAPSGTTSTASRIPSGPDQEVRDHDQRGPSRRAVSRIDLGRGLLDLGELERRGRSARPMLGTVPLPPPVRDPRRRRQHAAAARRSRARSGAVTNPPTRSTSGSGRRRAMFAIREPERAARSPATTSTIASGDWITGRTTRACTAAVLERRAAGRRRTPWPARRRERRP